MNKEEKEKLKAKIRALKARIAHRVALRHPVKNNETVPEWVQKFK